MVSKKIETNLENEDTEAFLKRIQPNQDGLRDAMMLLIPIAARNACKGSGQWALYLIKLAERYLPEWRDKKKSITTIDDYISIQERLFKDDTCNKGAFDKKTNSDVSNSGIQSVEYPDENFTG